MAAGAAGGGGQPVRVEGEQLRMRVVGPGARGRAGEEAGDAAGIVEPRLVLAAVAAETSGVAGVAAAEVVAGLEAAGARRDVHGVGAALRQCQ